MSDERVTSELHVPTDITAMIKGLPKPLVRKLSLYDIDLITKPFREELANLRADNEQLKADIEDSDHSAAIYHEALCKIQTALGVRCITHPGRAGCSDRMFDMHEIEIPRLKADAAVLDWCDEHVIELCVDYGREGSIEMKPARDEQPFRMAVEREWKETREVLPK